MARSKQELVAVTNPRSHTVEVAGRVVEAGATVELSKAHAESLIRQGWNPAASPSVKDEVPVDASEITNNNDA